MLDFEKTYLLSPEGRRTALHVHPRDESWDDIALLCGDWIPKTPLVFEHRRGAGGSIPRDFVDTGCYVRLMSQRMVDVLEPFTGWTTFPVQVYGKDKKLLPGYHGLRVTGRCGPIDPSRSEWIWCEPYSPRGKPVRKLLGWYFDEKSWDGSDIFNPGEGGGVALVVEKVKSALEATKITNLRFEPLSEILTSPSAYFGPDESKWK